MIHAAVDDVILPDGLAHQGDRGHLPLVVVVLFLEARKLLEVLIEGVGVSQGHHLHQGEERGMIRLRAQREMGIVEWRMIILVETGWRGLRHLMWLKGVTPVEGAEMIPWTVVVKADEGRRRPQGLRPGRLVLHPSQDTVDKTGLHLNPDLHLHQKGVDQRLTVILVLVGIEGMTEMLVVRMEKIRDETSLGETGTERTSEEMNLIQGLGRGLRLDVTGMGHEEMTQGIEASRMLAGLGNGKRGEGRLLVENETGGELGKFPKENWTSWDDEPGLWIQSGAQELFFVTWY
jgi:hypothetical protein